MSDNFTLQFVWWLCFTSESKKFLGVLKKKLLTSLCSACFFLPLLLQFIQNPGHKHWEAPKWVIIYLGCTKNLCLIFGGSSNTLVQEFCDIDWPSQKCHHSLSGYSFHIREGAGSWSLKKWYIITQLSMEFKYIGQTHATKEALWLQMFIKEIWGVEDGPTIINCDN